MQEKITPQVREGGRYEIIDGKAVLVEQTKPENKEQTKPEKEN